MPIVPKNTINYKEKRPCYFFLSRDELIKMIDYNNKKNIIHMCKHHYCTLLYVYNNVSHFHYNIFHLLFYLFLCIQDSSVNLCMINIPMFN